MIRHILKDGTTRKDMDGYLVSREACPEAYAAMERMTTNDNSRKTATRKEADGQVQGKSKACQV